MKNVSKRMTEVTEMILQKDKFLDKIYEKLSTLRNDMHGFHKEQIEEILTLLEEI